MTLYSSNSFDRRRFRQRATYFPETEAGAASAGGSNEISPALTLWTSVAATSTTATVRLANTKPISLRLFWSAMAELLETREETVVLSARGGAGCRRRGLRGTA